MRQMAVTWASLATFAGSATSIATRCRRSIRPRMCVFISTLAHEGQGLTFSKRWPAVCPNKSVAYASSGATSWWCTA